jgi:hypothetical protein
MAFAWKYLLPVAALNLLVIAAERLFLFENNLLDDSWAYWVLAAINIPLAVALLVGWARFVGYRPETVPLRPRLIREAGGYIPVETPGGGH